MNDTKKPQSLRTEAPTSAGDPPEVVSSASLKIQHELVKSLIPVGLFMTDDHRYYFNGEGPLPSVTTVLEILDKPALSTWKAQMASKAMITIARDMESLDKSDEELVKLALAEVRKNRDSAANVGSAVHHLADMALRPSEIDSAGWKIDESTQPYLDAYKHFTDHYSASSFVSSEKAVWSANGYAGTYDLLMMIDGELWLIDIKTGKNLYPEFGLQLAAYRWADSIILPDNPLPFKMPDVNRTGVLHLRPEQYVDGWCLWEYPTTYQDDFLTFLGLLEAYRWKQRGRFTKKQLQKHVTPV